MGRWGWVREFNFFFEVVGCRLTLEDQELKRTGIYLIAM